MKMKFGIKMNILFLSIFVISCDIGDKQIQIVELGTTKKVYINEVSWGMTGDSRRYYIGSSGKIADTIIEPYYQNSFFYKLEKDTFYVYTHYPAVRKHKWNGSVYLKEIFLSNPDTTNIVENYRKFNLKYSLWD